MRQISGIMMVLLLTSCGGGSPTDTSDKPPEEAAPCEVPLGITFVSYGTTCLGLDLYLPSEGSGPFPALVFIYGSAWLKGNRGQLSSLAQHLADKEFVGVTIEHRSPPAHKFPAALHDVKAAVRWLRANASTYNIDRSRIGIVGASSGGHLGALVATTEGFSEFEGEGNPGFSSAVQAVAAFNAPMDLVALRSTAPEWAVEVLDSFLGASYSVDPARWVKASPISHVTAASPPFLLLHGTQDQEIPHQQSIEMMNALTEAGVHVELFTAEDADHGFFNSEPWLSQAKVVLEDFFVRILK